jgi:hypothetical protein
MAVQTGTRPGTKPNQRIGGWDYVLCETDGWKKIRADDREVQRYDAAIHDACDRLEKALVAANVAFVMLHGGHVDKGMLARCGVRKDMEPSQVIAHIEKLLPTELMNKVFPKI